MSDRKPEPETQYDPYENPGYIEAHGPANPIRGRFKPAEAHHPRLLIGEHVEGALAGASGSEAHGRFAIAESPEAIHRRRAERDPATQLTLEDQAIREAAPLDEVKAAEANAKLDAAELTVTDEGDVQVGEAKDTSGKASTKATSAKKD